MFDTIGSKFNMEHKVSVDKAVILASGYGRRMRRNIAKWLQTNQDRRLIIFAKDDAVSRKTHC